MSDAAVPGTHVPTNEADIADPTVAGRPDFSTAAMLQENVQVLQALTESVKERGVCQADVAAVQQVLDEVKESIPDIDTKVGLERFQGLFTPEPSFLNHQASVESFGEAVIKIIKKLIEEACKLAKGAYGWVKAVIKELTSVDNKAEDIQGKVLEIRKLYQFLDPQFQWNNMDDAKAIAEQILLDPKLDRTWMQSAAFGHELSMASYTQSVRKLKHTADLLEPRLQNSVKMAEGLGFGVTAGVNLDDMLRELSVAEAHLQQFVQVQPNANYHVERYATFYLKAPTDVLATAEQLDLEEIAELYKKCEAHIARLNKIDFGYEPRAMAVEEMVGKVVTIMNTMDRMLEQLAGFSKARLKAMACHYNFFAKMISASHKRIIESNLSPEARSEQLKFLDAVSKAAR